VRSTPSFRPLVLPVLDGFILVGAFLLAVYLRMGQSWSDALAYDGLAAKAVVSTFVLQLCLYYSDLYSGSPLRRPIETALRLFQAFAAGLVALLIVYYVVPSLKVGRGIVALYIGLALLAVLFVRAIHRWLVDEEALAERVLILGTGNTAQELIREIQVRRASGLRVSGLLSEDPGEVGRQILSPVVVGTIDELLMLQGRFQAQRIVVALDDRRGTMPIADLLRCRFSGVQVEEGMSVLERLTGRIPTNNLRPSLLVFSQGFSESRPLRRLKNGGEALAAAFLLIVTAPAMLLVALAVKLSGPGPVIYRQERVGERGCPFALLKFRTMRTDAEATTGPVWASGSGDTRITPVGRFLRKTRLDELPQLVNVLRGEMSFVGPRPERPHFVEALRQVIPFYDERHTVRPGITGWAQVNSGYGSSIEDSELKLQYDLYYIKNMSIAFDLGIMLDTLKVVVVGRGAR
jgi:sugar transferase (PEP-CTERM system associated)